MLSKICKKCNKEKSIDLFYNAKLGVYGKRGSCIQCDKEYQHYYNRSLRKISPPEKRKQYRKKYYEKNKKIEFEQKKDIVKIIFMLAFVKI